MSCNFCERRGLALLPVRAAVVNSAARAPGLPDEIKTDIPAKGDVNYTCRQLREGYLYVYDERRNKWTDYFVTEDGYFWKMNNSSSVLAPQSGQKPCAGKVLEVAKSTFIALPLSPDISENGCFWLGWSEHPWTENIRKQHLKVDWREAHMQRFDLQEWLSTKKAGQALSLTHLTDVVAEFSSLRVDDKKLQFLSAKWRRKSQEDAQYIQQAALSLTMPPAKPDPTLSVILAIPDPIGIVRDLAELASRITEDFLAQQRLAENNKDFDRKFALNTMIDGMEYNVKESAKIRNLQLTAEEEKKLELGMVSMGGFTYNQRLGKKMAQDLHDITDKKLRGWSDEEWDKYKKYYRVSDKETFVESLDVARKKFEEEYCQPLVDMYLQMLKHTAFCNYFYYNYDSSDASSGGYYALTLAMCVLGGQDKGPCFDYYRTKLQGDVNDTRNPIIRAFVLNQDKLSQLMSKNIPTTVPAENLLGLPWNYLFSGVAACLDKLADAKDIISTLNVTLAGALISLFGRTVQGNVERLPVMLAVYSGNPLAYFEKSGEKMALSRELSRKVINETFDRAGLTPAQRITEKQRYANQVKSRLDTKEVITLLEKEMRLKAIDGIQLQGTDKYGFVALLTEDMDEMFKGKSVDEKIELIRQRMVTGEQAYDHYMKRSLSKTALKGNLISILFQCYAINNMIEKEKHWYGGVNSQSSIRLSACWGGVSGGAIELSAGTIKYGMLRMTGVVSSWVNVLANLGRYIGIIGGVVLAFCDGYEAWQQKKQEHMLLFRLYSVSAILGIAGIAAIMGGWVVFGLVVAVAIIAVAFLIEYYKPNDLQKWLEKNLWGKLPEGNYTSAEEEAVEYGKLWAIE
ncbi:hypothetical protein C3432_06060 [Citrobacter amalonaticus]|uniref:Toxin VasX N-terminal region domain-containing protein n=1 Tax=Citrobacter amalonaticus TaxID=35703 RepID=A0A2S4RZ01_CITAM|nr:T6SS effector BTH_I2691 family protein [Citrobacter amalonaticus]POT57524.1 hypothetical protein C3432_06060 [Citrobacter amalonaticus]POT76949.1 hypothetical protein C3436_05760 [Citrobacter amalonaticus]POU66027.1 hypothetical protein C3430_12175 [Citrobacter amalonaticus]POV06184.1 hypothetical protein C3424_13060 [Citrobacter amalonaticus]